MTFTPVKSSAFKGYNYNNERKILVLQFNNDTEVAFYHVSQEIVDGMLTAESVGKYYHAVIKHLPKAPLPEDDA